MHILWLGHEREKLIDFMRQQGDSVVVTALPPEKVDWRNGYDFIVSYGYRHIIGPEIISTFWRKAINLHISLLPWNRGADPNLWSFLEDTPKGVTIHYLDHGIDTGDIIIQKAVDYHPNDTLRTSYQRLCEEIERLFIENWEAIKKGKVQPKPQPRGQGTYHRSADKGKYIHLLSTGWDTPVRILVGAALARD